MKIRPERGKSTINQCFCPFRAWVALRIYPGRCPGLRVNALSGHIAMKRAHCDKLAKLESYNVWQYFQQESRLLRLVGVMEAALLCLFPEKNPLLHKVFLAVVDVGSVGGLAGEFTTGEVEVAGVDFAVVDFAVVGFDGADSADILEVHAETVGAVL